MWVLLKIHSWLVLLQEMDRELTSFPLRWNALGRTPLLVQSSGFLGPLSKWKDMGVRRSPSLVTPMEATIKVCPSNLQWSNLALTPSVRREAKNLRFLTIMLLYWTLELLQLRGLTSVALIPTLLMVDRLSTVKKLLSPKQVSIHRQDFVIVVVVRISSFSMFYNSSPPQMSLAWGPPSCTSSTSDTTLVHTKLGLG